MDELKTDLAALRSQIRDLAEDLTGLGKSLVPDTSIPPLLEPAQRMLDSTRQQITRSPVKMLVGAFAAGFLLAEFKKRDLLTLIPGLGFLGLIDDDLPEDEPETPAPAKKTKKKSTRKKPGTRKKTTRRKASSTV